MDSQAAQIAQAPEPLNQKDVLQIVELCLDLQSKELTGSKFLAEMEKIIGGLRLNAIEEELSEAQKQKEAKEKEMLLKILLVNGFDENEAENFI